MRILIIHCAYLHMGGEDVVVKEEIDLLRSKGNEVELLLFSNSSRPLFNLLQLPFNLSSYLSTQKVIKEFKPELVHIHNLHFSGSTSVIYAINKRIPIIYTLHNYRLICPSGSLAHKGKLFLKSISSSFPWLAAAKGVYRKSVPVSLWLAFNIWLNHKVGTWRLVSRFIALTEHSKQIFENSKLGLTSNQIVVKPNFTQLNTGPDVQRSSYFLYVGRLSQEKGIDNLLDAFTQSAYRLVIIGSGPMENEVVERAKTNPNIVYLGFQNKEVIVQQMQECSALIFPSKWYETFGLTIIEAFASGTPVLAADIGAASLLVKPQYNGLTFKPDNVDDLKDKIKLWHNATDETKRAYGINAKQTYEQYYTPDKNYEQLIAIYRGAIDSKKGE